MIKYAILGYGVVGSGVAEVMAEQAEKIARVVGDRVELKYILVRHDYPGDPYADRMVTDFAVIENDPEVSVVAEVIGGIGAAYDYSKRALLAGKSVVSSNKELVAVHGAEFCEIAREKGVNYLFEGSVGGGIPLLRPLTQCLAANRIDEVFGILNGTTNYILTAMDAQGQSFEEALKKAQELGYAEADPTADVEGIDACRKTAILADLAFGWNMDPLAIPTRGITAITSADLELASALGYAVKLLGRAIRAEGGCCAFVEPHLIPQSRLLASVSGVMNACVVRGSAVGKMQRELNALGYDCGTVDNDFGPEVDKAQVELSAACDKFIYKLAIGKNVSKFILVSTTQIYKQPDSREPVRGGPAGMPENRRAENQ